MMKKLFSFLLITVYLNLSAQDNWQKVDTSGIELTDTVAQFTVLQKFNGRLYTGGYSNNLNTLSLYSSPTGNPFSFAKETNFSSLALPTGSGSKIKSSTANNNYMFLGSGVTSGGGGPHVPQVYRVNTGGSYANIGPNSGDYAALISTPAQIPSGNGRVDALAQFSPTGSNDTIYAFVSPDNGYNTISVWKAPVNTTSPTWQLATIFNGGITQVFDAAVWHKRLYIGVSHADSVAGYSYHNSLILSTANGTSWDTVATVNSFLSNYGGANSNNSYGFTALEIHNDTLVAALSNAGGPSLWYTTDQGSATPNWHVLFNNNDSPLYFVNDLQSDGYNIWITELGYYINIYRYNAGIYANNNGFLFNSTSQTYLGDYSSTDSYKLQYYNTAIYTAGNYYGNYYHGTIDRLFIPKAAFTDSVVHHTAFCSGDTVGFKNHSTNAINYEWFDVNTNSVYSTSADTSKLFINPGTYTFTLKAYNGVAENSITDSVTKVITIYESPSLYVNITDYQICQGQRDTITASVVGGTAPYTYNIQVAAGTYTNSTVSFTTAIAGAITPSVTVTDNHGCTAMQAGPQFTVGISDALSGTVKEPNSSPVSAGTAYLFKEKSTHVGVGDTTATDNFTNGFYSFPNVYYGNYWVKIVANATSYPSAVGTYYGTNPNSYQWYLADTIMHHGCTASANSGNDITIIEVPPLTGPGVISGYIYKDPSYGHRGGNGNNSVMGAPLKGIDVKLGRNPGGGCAARTVTTDTNSPHGEGYYEFTNLPDSSYRIYVDIPNYGMDSVRVVTLSASNNNSVNNNYHVDSTTIYIDTTTTGIVKVSASSASIDLKVYPNPVSDRFTVSFTNEKEGDISFELFDIAGNRISTLYNNRTGRGEQQLAFSLKELALSKGVYFVKANVNGTLQTFKLTVMED